MEIKKLDLSYIDEIINYEKLYFDTTLGAQYIINDINNNEYARYFIMLDNDKLVGYIGINVDLYGEILNFFIVDNYRGQGHGIALLNCALKEAKQSGSISISLEVKETNTPAISLYEKLGFKISHKRKGYYNGIDAIVMIKEM